MRQERLNEIWGVFALLLGLFTLASLLFFRPEDIAFYTSHPQTPVHNYAGVTGANLAFWLFLTFGLSAFLIPLLFLLWAGCFFLQRVPEKKIFKFAGLGIALFSMATLVAIAVPQDERFNEAGAVGYLAGTHLLRYFGLVGSTIVAASCLLLSLLLATDFLLYPLIRGFLEKVQLTGSAAFGLINGALRRVKDVLSSMRVQAPKPEKTRPAKPAVEKKEKEKPKAKTAEVPAMPDIPLKVTQYRPDLSDSAAAEGAEELKKAVLSENPRSASEKEKAESVKTNPAEKHRGPSGQVAAALNAISKSDREEENEGAHEGVIGSKAVSVDYQFPPLDLLRKPAAPGAAGAGDDLTANSKILEETLARFGIQVKVVEIEQGPVITRYELLPAPGVKVNSITSLQDDIALALKAMSIRLIIPIPGKSAIGIEVPNTVSSVVSLRELIDSQLFKSKKCELPLVLGKDTSGKTLIADLASMPHIIIAGTTGSGKTVCVNSIIVSLLYHATPDQLKLVMIDPKMVEMAVYNRVPHMLTPVVTNVKKAAHTLNWVVNEMENRYKLLAAVGKRNIQAFNERPMSEEAVREVEGKDSENVVPAKLPYIVVIIDELADLMMVAQDKVEGAIARLAQLARAVGIHLIVATQRPSVDVITGVIKANFPARISFKVASKVDSRTILDQGGADKLLGKGDMLFLKPGMEKLIRGQAPYVTDDEINGVVDFWANQAKPEYHPEIASAQEGRAAAEGAGEKDELFDEAVAVVLETGQASTSNLQRRMRLGYTRAARIIDQMEAEGLIGPAQGAKPREIYMAQAQQNTASPSGAES